MTDSLPSPPPALLRNGPGAAAILSAAIGSCAFGVFAFAADAVPAINRVMAIWKPTGALSGVSTAGIVVWLVAWFVLSRRWAGRDVRLAVGQPRLGADADRRAAVDVPAVYGLAPGPVVATTRENAMNRRTLLQQAAAVAMAGVVPAAAWGAGNETRADYTLRIATGLVELAPDHIVSTTLYNGQFPGPLLRLRQGQRVVVDIRNDTDTPELVHWHGQMIPPDVDGAAEEGSPFVPPHGAQRVAFEPKPAGLPLLPHACAGFRRPQPRHLHRPGRPGLYRAGGRPRGRTTAKSSWC